jgi:predicted O-methyltransferase YrrM
MPLKSNAKRLLRKMFEQGQRLGVDVLPRHFYSEIPNVSYLRRTAHWRAPYSMAGVAGAEIASQVEFVRACCTPPVVEKITTARIHEQACARNGAVGFGPVEADFLYALVASRRPKQIFQIGCGVSTAVCLLAAAHAGYIPEIVCVEPYPTPYLVAEANRGSITLLREMAQTLSLSTVEGLGDDVLFFVDSTHALGPAGEVSRIMLEMLPRLKSGAYAHFHDITFPYDYSRHVLDSALFFQHESVLLHAFLAFNRRFRLLAALSMLHYAAPEALTESIPNYRPAGNDGGLNVGQGHFPSSAYLRVVA